MSQLDDLKNNIDNLTKNIFKIKENLSKSKPFDIDNFFLTARQIQKKITILNLKGTPIFDNKNTIISSNITESDIDIIESAHLIVYGPREDWMISENPSTKNLYPFSKIIDDDKSYPNCVSKAILDAENRVKTPKPDIKQWIIDKKKEVSNSFKILHYKADDLKAAFKQCVKEIGLSTATISASATILPIGSGAPAAIQSMASIVTSVMNLQEKITDIIPLLSAFTYIGLLIVESAIDTVVGSINIVLDLINAALELIKSITSNELFITAKSLIG